MSTSSDELLGAIHRVNKWAEELEAAYDDGGYAAGDGPPVPELEDVYILLDFLKQEIKRGAFHE